MSSQAQIFANRENSKSSTGPVTAQGKTASAANSTKHGLSSAFSVLPHEDLEEYKSLVDGYIADFQPNGVHEQFLVQQMYHARWRIARAYRLENLYFEMASDDPSPDAAIVLQMMNKGVDVPSMLHRYLASAERSYYQAHKTLISGRSQTARTAAAESRTAAAKAEKQFFDCLKQPPPIEFPGLQNEANRPLTRSSKAR